MILDNKNTNFKVHEWIAKYTKEGKFSLVTGYFTIGALAYQPQTLRNNAQTIRKLYCALLRDIRETILEIVKILSVYLSNFIHFA